MKRALVLRDFSANDIERMKMLGLKNVSPAPNNGYETVLIVQPTTRGYVLMSAWAYGMAGFQEDEICICGGDRKVFYDTLTKELYDMSGCLDEAIDICNGTHEIFSTDLLK